MLVTLINDVLATFIAEDRGDICDTGLDFSGHVQLRGWFYYRRIHGPTFPL